MGIRDAICPLCGGPAEEGVCNRCRAGTVTWFTCDQRIEPVRCPSCDAVKKGGRWADTGVPLRVLEEELVRQAVHFHPDVRSPVVSLVIGQVSENRSFATVSVRGSLYGNQMEGECRIEVLWRKEQCDRCNRLTGNYWEGIIQVRAVDRRPNMTEIDRAMQIATEIENTLQEGGERLSFVSRMSESKDGVDITVGSQQIGQQIASEIIHQLGGRLTTHPKLFGEKDGRKLYRITYLVRLPRLSRGDIISARGHLAEVLNQDGHDLSVFDIVSGSIRTIREEETGAVIGNSANALTGEVAYRDGDVIGIIDPETSRTIEARVRPWLKVKPGGRVRYLVHQGSVVLVG